MNNSELTEKQKADLQYLEKFYGWDAQDKRGVMESIRSTSSGALYYTVLAAAHRAGYEQTPENNYMRLTDWCAARGLFPFAPDFELAALGELLKPIEA